MHSSTVSPSPSASGTVAENTGKLDWSLLALGFAIFCNVVWIAFWLWAATRAVAMLLSLHDG